MTHLLWDNPNGRTILWDVNPDGSFTVGATTAASPTTARASTVWKAVALATGPDGLSHVLFDNADGHTLLWNLDAATTEPADSGNPPRLGGSPPRPRPAPTACSRTTARLSTLWHAQALSVGQDNLPRILWTNPDGRTILWNVNPRRLVHRSPATTPRCWTANGQGGFTAVALATGGTTGATSRGITRTARRSCGTS